MIEAVVFDLDGLLIETEEVWDEVREALAHEQGGRWSESAQRDMMGMSSTEWSRYMHETVGLVQAPEEINDLVVERIAACWPLGVASSSNRVLIDLVLELSGLAPRFRATVSSEEVPRGKPAPDVYLEAARRVGVQPTHAAAVEDSSAGIRSASAAGMRVVAIPNRSFPPGEGALEVADVVLESLAELTPEAIEA